MRQSQLFTKTRKEAPKDEVSKNAELLVRAGYVHKHMAGVYEFLPLGLRVMNKISGIVREEINAFGGIELKMTVLQDSKCWDQTGRWSDEVVDNWFKSKLKNETEVGLAFTHEEPLTDMLRNHIRSYKDLPIFPYQIQAKFRNELRAKSGILRGREFLMKDMYCFARSGEEINEYYEKSKDTYEKIFERCGLGDITYVTFASGGTFSKFSHEFQTLSENGEDIIYVDEKSKIAVNKDVYNDENLNDFGLTKNSLVEKRSIEVGNIFNLGTKFSNGLGLTYKDEEGKEQQVHMASFGIGISRLMGTIVEVLADEKGLVWPKAVSPFDYHLISVGKEIKDRADEIYLMLKKNGIDVLYDDRDLMPGEKFGDADLLGIPNRLIISEKSLEKGGVEFSDVRGQNPKIVSPEDLLNGNTS